MGNTLCDSPARLQIRQPRPDSRPHKELEGMSTRRLSQPAPRRALMLFGVLSMLLGCAPAEPSSSPGPLLALPTYPPELQLCLGLGAEGAVLHGDPTREGLTWLDINGEERAILWPAGYRARFSPALEVVDNTGRVVLREGSSISGVCAGPEGKVILRPPFGGAWKAREDTA